MSYWTPGTPPTRGVHVPIGKANVVLAGSDVTLLSYSGMMTPCAAVAAKLATEGVKVELIDLRTISPWDSETVLASVAATTRRAVVVHEAVRNFGVGAEIAATIHERLFGTLKAPVQRVGAAYCAVPFSKPLETAFMPGPVPIEAAVRKALG